MIQRAQLSREEWLEALARIIRADIRKMFDSYGTPLPVGVLPSIAVECVDPKGPSLTPSHDWPMLRE